MSPEQTFNVHFERVTDLTDRAVNLIDTEDALGASIAGLYKAIIDHADAVKAGAEPDPRRVLVAYGGLRAVHDQVGRQLDRIGQLLDVAPERTSDNTSKPEGR